MTKNTTIAFVYLIMALQVNAQKKSLDHADFNIWKTIERPQVSNDGRWVVYEVAPEEGDGVLHVYDGSQNATQQFERGTRAKIDANNEVVAFLLKPPADTLKAMQRRKVKKDDQPKDTLALLNLSTGVLTKIPEVLSFQIPDKWGGWVACQLAASQAKNDDKQAGNSKKNKKESTKNGSKLLLINLQTQKQDTVDFVTQYLHAEQGNKFALVTSGDESDLAPGVYIFDGALQPVWQKKADYKNLTFDLKGTQLAFLADEDTTQAKVRPFGLYHWKQGQVTASLAAGNNAGFFPSGWRISEHGNLTFSKDGTKLFFGTSPQPIIQDTTLLPTEIVNVEVWAYDQPVLYTQQEVQAEREKRRNYRAVLHTNSGKLVQLGNEEVPEILLDDESNTPWALAYTTRPYSLADTWEAWNKRDLYLVDVLRGDKKLVGKGIDGNANFSPGARFVYWYSSPDSAWFTYEIASAATRQITTNSQVAFYNELFDEPDDPNPYGIAGWLENDAALLVYDRYDIWKIDPRNAKAPERISNSRPDQRRIRIIRYDTDQRFFSPGASMLVSVFEENTKENGLAWLDPSNGRLTTLQYGAYDFSGSPLKAKNAEKWVFTRENYHVFSDLLYSNDLKTFRQISNANPQQKDYQWGSVELVEWTALDGQKVQGMLFKPEGFDPQKQYPLLVNFYEKSSQSLYSHRAPYPHRSTLNYTFYTSRGYLVFNPDIPYRIGYPGESALNAVIPGVTALIDKGFVDKKRIGVQGHSWGGYQIAYLLTKTDIFRCAEAGAPVVNMFSAYGGIRWGTGLSRAFQYEHAQSRIGGTPWQYPLRYLENSPLFSIDKINTPTLIMHNDEDAAVPWYQGIEFFIAMRRLGKPAWLLNYNGEPHWPVKRQNRLDFNKRMQQFFDHYLLGAPN